MSAPKTTNGLMRHLRNNCNININDSFQKKQLEAYGYYHGYKGCRFVKKPENRIPYKDFQEVVAVIEYDNNLKAVLFPELMFVETAVKSMVCTEIVNGLSNGTFEHVFRERMCDHPEDSALQSRRLRLRNHIYTLLSEYYDKESNRENRMIHHFYDQGQDVPLWTVFEIISIQDLAMLIRCLNDTTRKQIDEALMIHGEPDTLLASMLESLFLLQDSVIHNQIIFDSRFSDREIDPLLQTWLAQETGIEEITLNSLVDYFIILCILSKRMDFKGTRAKNLLNRYREENFYLQCTVPTSISEVLITWTDGDKVLAMDEYLSRL